MALLVAHGHDEHRVVHEYGYGKLLLYLDAVRRMDRDGLIEEFFNIRTACNADKQVAQKYINDLSEKKQAHGENTEQDLIAFNKRLREEAKRKGEQIASP